MVPLPPLPIFSFFFLVSHLLTVPATSNVYETNALTLFRLQADAHGYLLANWTGPDACIATWRGVGCSPRGHVTSLVLPSLSLRGPLASLSSLPHLRFLDLHNNRLNGTVAPLANCTRLRLLYLSANDLSGPIPGSVSSLTRLLRLDLSNNNLQGEIPGSLTNLTELLTLRLQDNELSGPIPVNLSTSLPFLTQLNLSNNELSGPVPESLLKRFGARSFSGNLGLCGPRSKCKVPITPGFVPSNPSSIPQTPRNLTLGDDRSSSSSRKKGLSPGAVAAIAIANCVAVLVAAAFLVAYCCGGGNSKAKVDNEDGKRRSSSGKGGEDDDDDYMSEGTTGTEKSKLVFYGDDDRSSSTGKQSFELEELLRASAEMLGKGSLGTVYKAALDGGSTVAVKRLKDANPCGRREFEQYMDVIGRLKHPHVVRFRAYYYAREEKLLVYDYLPNGSLYYLLHGNRGPGRIPLDWTTRISLVLGAARGLAKIHQEYSAPRIPHGNVKSSNVLLDKNGVACISDFGLSLLLNPAHAIARLGGYKAPEQSETKRLSQPADVYGFGVLLLEVLTGRAPSQYPPASCPRVVDDAGDATTEDDLPKWVRSVVKEEWTGEVFDQELLRYKNIEEELVAMLHVGLACVAPRPEERPTMAQVVKMIEDIRVEQSPLGEDYDESRNSMSPSLATTEDGLAAY